jgi:ERCC4-type nuclease
MLIDSRERDSIANECRRLGLPVTVTQIELGTGEYRCCPDCLFEGNGPSGACLVGVERKRLGDLINSMKDRRLSGQQLRNLARVVDFVFVIVEAVFRPGPGGEIEELQGREWRTFYKHGNVGDRAAISYRQLISYLTTLELCGNVIVRRTSNVRETAAQLVALYGWFNEKRWEQHHSHDQIHHGGMAVIKGHGSDWGTDHTHDEEYEQPARGRAVVTAENPTTAWRWAADLPGIDRKAEVIAKHFGTARALANANCERCAACDNHGVRDEKEWQRIEFGVNGEGKRKSGIGPVTSRAVVRAITEPGA